MLTKATECIAHVVIRAAFPPSSVPQLTGNVEMLDVELDRLVILTKIIFYILLLLFPLQLSDPPPSKIPSFKSPFPLKVCHPTSRFLYFETSPNPVIRERKQLEN